MKYIFETTYPVSQKFLEKSDLYMSGHHMGTDFACPTGTKVFAPAKGVITKVIENHAQMGNCIFYRCVIDNQAYTLRFMHLSVPMPMGDYEEEALIAVTGNTGNSTGPHLHVDVTRGEFDIKNLYTYEGVVSNLVDFETWCPTEYHKKPVEAPVEPKNAPTLKVLTKDEIISFFNTFVTIFATVAIPQLSTFDWDNASQASLIALGGSILRMALKATTEKFLSK